MAAAYILPTVMNKLASDMAMVLRSASDLMDVAGELHWTLELEAQPRLWLRKHGVERRKPPNVQTLGRGHRK